MPFNPARRRVSWILDSDKSKATTSDSVLTHPMKHKFTVDMLDSVKSETSSLSGLRALHELFILGNVKVRNLLPVSIYPRATGPPEPRGVDGLSASKDVKFKEKPFQRNLRRYREGNRNSQAHGQHSGTILCDLVRLCNRCLWSWSFDPSQHLAIENQLQAQSMQNAEKTNQWNVLVSNGNCYTDRQSEKVWEKSRLYQLPFHPFSCNRTRSIPVNHWSEVLKHGQSWQWGYLDLSGWSRFLQPILRLYWNNLYGFCTIGT